ncbi:hypothetical protein CapIbe_019784 [Capra ibex]
MLEVGICPRRPWTKSRSACSNRLERVRLGGSKREATHKCPSASRTATREVSLQSATKWGRRCDYCSQHLENIRSAPTSSVLYPSYWIFPSVNIVEVPLQHRHS